MGHSTTFTRTIFLLIKGPSTTDTCDMRMPKREGYRLSHAVYRLSSELALRLLHHASQSANLLTLSTESRPFAELAPYFRTSFSHQDKLRGPPSTNLLYRNEAWVFELPSCEVHLTRCHLVTILFSTERNLGPYCHNGCKCLGPCIRSCLGRSDHLGSNFVGKVCVTNGNQ